MILIIIYQVISTHSQEVLLWLVIQIHSWTLNKEEAIKKSLQKLLALIRRIKHRINLSELGHKALNLKLIMNFLQ